MMKKQISFGLSMAGALFALLVISNTASAQFPIKVPKIQIPTTKQETTKTTSDRQNQPAAPADSASSGAFRVGDKVELYCNCFGPTKWVPAVIEEVLGNGMYKVRYGQGRYEYQTKSADAIRDPKQAAIEANQKEMRRQFWDEARKYNQSVYYLMSFHDENLRVGNNIYGAPQTAENWEKTMRELGELDRLCTGKYSGMTNDQNNAFKNDLDHLPATWCEIAARRFEYEKAGRAAAVRQRTKLMFEGMSEKMQQIMKDPENRISDDYQVLIFEREKWIRDKKAELAPMFAELKVEMPPDFLDLILSKAEELKRVIDENAAGRSWEQPQFNRPAEQAIAKTKFLEMYKGATILKIGSTYTDWKIYRTPLGIPTDRYIRGWALLKIPNRPFCQAQEWIVKQDYTGGGRWSATRAHSVGGSGVLMKCQ